MKGAPGSKFLGDVYSGAVDDTFVRFVANATLGRPHGRRRVLDVKGAYYEGVTIPASAGGRSLWGACWNIGELTENRRLGVWEFVHKASTRRPQDPKAPDA